MFLIYPYLAMPLLVPPPLAAPVLITAWMSPTPLPWARPWGQTRAAGQGAGFAAIDLPVMGWNSPMPGPAIFSR